MTGAETLTSLGDLIASQVRDDVLRWSVEQGELTIETKPGSVVSILTFLKTAPECRFLQLIDLCAVDFPQRAKRFDVVYHLLSLSKNLRVRVKAAVGEEETIASVIAVYPNAGWYEREAFDLFGVVFTGNPDLRRILTDYNFEGYPLRKDFPLTGYVEVRYDDEQKRVVYEPVKLVQDYRNFDYLSPWEGADYVIPGDEKAKAKQP
ncbi:MAG: NADH-quinone oxidoreductase subunit C [Parvularculaceae bacterium]|nr:NADH-quinone oxidoreductase subunit C [Parvularculaceae bacterium]